MNRHTSPLPIRVLITGASGMLGSALAESWARDRSLSVFATGREPVAETAGIAYRQFDLERDNYEELADWARPEVIVHCAAFTNVDACEDDPARAMKINAHSVTRFAERIPSARILFISTDAVLAAGSSGRTEETRPSPTNVYGRSKQLAEELLAKANAKHCAIRTTPVGWNRNAKRQSFAEWILRTASTGGPVPLFRDAIFCPIATWDLAHRLRACFDADLPPILHIAGAPPCTKYEFGTALLRELGLSQIAITATSVRDVSFRAPRTADQSLDCRFSARVLGRDMPAMEETVRTLARNLPSYPAFELVNVARPTTA